MTIHDEAHAGQYLKWYERARYTEFERSPSSYIANIIVQPDAEQFADVSFWQADMNWDEYRKHARAVILRIGQNVWKDVEFETNYREARRVGLLIGGYWFFDGRATPQQQADVIIAAMSGKHFEMELFIDWERNYGGQYEGLPNVVKLMQLVEAAGVRCKGVGVYTGYYFFTANSNASANGAQYTYVKQRPIWLAWYAAPSVVRVPAPWTDWVHWQFGTPAVSWGQPTAEIDMNYYNGTPAQFTARYGGGISQPPEGETMSYFKVTASVLNLRSSAAVINSPTNDIGDVYANDVLKCSDTTVLGSSTTWREVTEIWRNNTPVPLPASPKVWVAAPYLVATTFVPPAPEPVLPSVLYIGTTPENVTKYERMA